ncbi:hypothetical protein CEH05_03575 [Halobacillus halophilus]|uniref:ABC-type transport system permease protein n=1 Tax=Halobacillus halophilus (strain ATCC 35676 / DSM 2266 / JCM 20832 / KCTC 3685 / LMG 17431 / NBRC 102448 / NCIMB 2269) TaxID=866895 RepID=I0JIV1_HALH3|nr:hypothetical protein [Halobacillus halophilus]ASF38240.1 hypothetical protein CEH05_03575 [Halobacillus halophilus]CCG44069.1 conserved hypothetical protein [Halobacillus halophilus DSM 2266]
MTSLTEVSTREVIGKQYHYKLKAYMGILTSLVTVQLLGLLFSLNGVGSRSLGTFGLDLNINYYSADMIIIFTFFWGFMSALLMTTKAYREDDFAFITNRFSSNMSSVAFIATVSVIGGLTAIMASFLLKVVVYFILGNKEVIGTGLASGPLTFTEGVLAMILLVFLFSSLGYLAGIIVQVHRVFVVLLPVLFFGGLQYLSSTENWNLPAFMFEFYFQESLFLLFAAKVVASAALVFTIALWISDQLEVKK